MKTLILKSVVVVFNRGLHFTARMGKPAETIRGSRSIRSPQP
jgi:hypothetical protein